MNRFCIACLALVLAACASVPPAPARDDVATASGADPGFCREHQHQHHAGQNAGEQRAAMVGELLAFQELAEEALSMRARAIGLFHELHAKTSRHEPLSGLDLQRLKQGAAALVSQREVLLAVAQAHECWLDDSAAGDPGSAAVRDAGLALSLAAALILYDNYRSAISLYRDDPVLRNHLNRADSGFSLHSGELSKVTLSFAAIENRQRLLRALRWFVDRQATAADLEGYAYAARLIEQSPSLHVARQASPLRDLGDGMGIFGSLLFDGVAALKDESSNFSSLVLGNTLGLVESRRGKLDRQPAITRQVEATLKAGDILLEKTPFRLTDAFIPGHWGHAAVWIGSEAELRALGLWDEPLVRRHHEAIRSGRGIVEALRSGVEMNSVAHFLNIDDLAILRQEALPDAQRAEVVLQALRQVGKAYDFNFDVESTDKIVCSELVYHTYLKLEWPTVRRLGRATISPDNVAIRATGDGPLTVALLYHDGQEIRSEPRRFMEKLVRPEPPRLTRVERRQQEP